MLDLVNNDVWTWPIKVSTKSGMQDAATEGKEGSDGSYSSVVRRISVEHELQQLQRGQLQLLPS